MARTDTSIQTIAPQTRAAVGLDTYIQSFPDPNAGQDLADIAQALGIVASKVEKSAAQTKADNEAAYSQNLDYYAQTFMHDHTNGIVDATQVGRAYPGASPIVAGKITGLIGQNWGNDYARTKLDSFLAAGDSVRLDPVAQRNFFNELRADVTKQTEGNPFYGQGALSATNSIINEYESNLQREAAGGQQAIQEENFKSTFGAGLSGEPVAGLSGEPVAGAAPDTLAQGTADPASVSFLTSRLVDAGKTSDIADMQPGFASGLTAMFQGAPPEIQADLQITSGTRSAARQKVLFDAAVIKYGSEAAARKWVAPPGKSMHGKGEAADIHFGSAAAKKWAHENAAQFGLVFPLSNEDWHIEPVGGRSGAARPHTAGVDTTTAPTALLEILGKGESGSNYNAYYGNAGNTAVKFTDMSITDVIEWQRQNIAGGGNSALGKYGFLRPTLQGAMKEMGIDPSAKLTPQLQDSIAMHLLEKRGYKDFVAGKMTASEFQDNIAKEWASAPTSAGTGYYHGQNPSIDSGALRVAMSTTGPVGSPAEAVDAHGLTTGSINPIRQRELGVGVAVEMATAKRDTSILDRIPEAWKTIPEVAAKIAAAKEAIGNLTFDSWTHQQTVDRAEKADALEKGQQDILNTLATDGSIDIGKYMGNPDLYNFAKSVQGDERVRPEVSASNVGKLEQQLLGYGTVGIPASATGADDFEKMRNIIITAPGLTAADRTKMLGSVSTYLDGVNLINDDKTDAYYRSYVGDSLSTYLMTLDGTMAKMLGTNPSGQVRETFDTTMQHLITSSIEDGHGIPRGKAKLDMLKEAKAAAMETFKGLKDTIAGAATTTSTPTAPAAPSPTPPSPDQLRLLEEGVRAKQARGETLTEEDFNILYPVK